MLLLPTMVEGGVRGGRDGRQGCDKRRSDVHGSSYTPAAVDGTTTTNGIVGWNAEGNAGANTLGRMDAVTRRAQGRGVMRPGSGCLHTVAISGGRIVNARVSGSGDRVLQIGGAGCDIDLCGGCGTIAGGR
jgi:hypothetical protein